MQCLFQDTGEVHPEKSNWRVQQCIICGRVVTAPRLIVAECLLLKDVDAASCCNRREQLRLEICETCNGKTRIKIFACDVHSECTIEKSFDSIAGCGPCREHSERIAALAALDGVQKSTSVQALSISGRSGLD